MTEKKKDITKNVTLDGGSRSLGLDEATHRPTTYMNFPSVPEHTRNPFLHFRTLKIPRRRFPLFTTTTRSGRRRLVAFDPRCRPLLCVFFALGSQAFRWRRLPSGGREDKWERASERYTRSTALCTLSFSYTRASVGLPDPGRSSVEVSWRHPREPGTASAERAF